MNTILSATSLVAVLAVIATGANALAQATNAPATPPSDPPSDRLRAAASVLADVPSVQLVGYPVTGASPRAIRRSINDGRPTSGEDGERHDALTLWRYSMQTSRSRGGDCMPEGATVSLRVTVTLPDLTTHDALSSRERAEWDRYFAALVTHERNHARIALLGAERAEAAMRSAGGCDAMREAARQVMADVSAASVEYDRMTEHGRREGAVYPSSGR